jgi:hypothetical protein
MNPTSIYSFCWPNQDLLGWQTIRSYEPAGAPLPVGLRQINPTGKLALHRTPKSVI